jgi:hypothetical protein
VARKRPPGLPPGAPAAADTVYRLKISLHWLRPMIWRRVEVPDCTLRDLHRVIQACMPWTNSHMWSFEVSRDERYGDEDDEELDYRSADRVRLSDLAARGVKKFGYLYDFGDSWEHVIAFEKPVARDPEAAYPRCVAGARACPPDDCGGPPGYEHLLAVLADPNHPDHAHMLEWAGGPIDPEAFDQDAANRNLRQLARR